MVERRNYPMRAFVLQRVVRWLITQNAQDVTVIDRPVRERILKCLARMWLAQEVAGQWIPTPVFRNPATLIEVEV